MPQMKLTPFQRKVLLRYKGFLNRPPTPLRIFASVFPQILFQLGVVIFSAYTLPETVTAFFGGIFVGTVVYQIAFSLRVLEAVATLLQFLDWNRLDQALAGAENDGYAASSPAGASPDDA
jgi:hypothetical protein